MHAGRRGLVLVVQKVCAGDRVLEGLEKESTRGRRKACGLIRPRSHSGVSGRSYVMIRKGLLAYSVKVILCFRFHR